MAITLEQENPTSMESAADLVAATERDGVEFLFAMFVDMHGKPCAKLVPVSAIEGLMADESNTPPEETEPTASPAAGESQETGAADQPSG